jgi:1,4-alpha-glucan branching enzyme
MVADNDDVAARLLAAVDGVPRSAGRDATLDALAVQAALALSSDWAFMVSKDSAAAYARERAATHADHVDELTRLRADGRTATALRRVAAWPAGPFGHVDVRVCGQPGKMVADDN